MLKNSPEIWLKYVHITNVIKFSLHVWALEHSTTGDATTELKTDISATTRHRFVDPSHDSLYTTYM